MTLALCYPAPLVNLGGFSMSLLIVQMLQIIMFGMGTSMRGPKARRFRDWNDTPA